MERFSPNFITWLYPFTLEEIGPYLVTYGLARVLWRLRSALSVIGQSMSWGDEATTSADSAGNPDSATVGIVLSGLVNLGWKPFGREGK